MIYHYTILLIFSEHILQNIWRPFTFFIVIVHVFSTSVEKELLFFIHFIQNKILSLSENTNKLIEVK